MSVDDWARREAEQYAYGDVYGDIQLAFRVGVASLADVLMSDEAVEAAARSAAHRAVAAPRPWESLTGYGRQQFLKAARADIQAAIDAVTKEER